MSDISKIKLGDETYNVKDARIVSGTANSVEITGRLILFCAVADRSVDMYLNSVTIIHDSTTDMYMEGSTMKVSSPYKMNYIAIIKD